MAVQEGDRLPNAKVYVINDGVPKGASTEKLAAGKKVVLFAVPGAFTPTCSERHLPSFIHNLDALKAKGVDEVLCMSVNDAFVMDAWGKDRGASGITMVADGNGDFAEALGLVMDGSGFGLGKRSERFAMVIDDGTITKLAVEEAGKYKVSSAEAILEAL